MNLIWRTWIQKHLKFTFESHQNLYHNTLKSIYKSRLPSIPLWELVVCSAAVDKPEPEVDNWMQSFPCHDATQSIKKFRYEIHARNRHKKRFPFNPIQGQLNPV
jgi:hypothetical protein